MVQDVPSIKHFFHPILKVLAEADAPLKRSVYAQRVADKLALTEEQRALRIPSGRHLTYRHRAGWATNVLKNAGLIESAGGGTWVLTEEGQRFVDAHPQGLSAPDIAEIRKRAKANATASEPDDASPWQGKCEGVDGEDEVSPEEQIQRALETLREAMATELLHRLRGCDPDFFEQVVLHVLQKLGYGKGTDALRHVGGSGDGGIDGIISLDRLGLEKVYVQAKRWQSNVGRPEIQGFFGALSGRHATKGVFITCSDFTKEAREFAATASDSLALVSGRELARLMIENEVGVRLRPEYLPEIDNDYFAEE